MNEIKTIYKDNIKIKYGIIHGGKKPFVMLPGVSLGSILVNINTIESAYEEILKDYTIYVFEHALPDDDDFSICDEADDAIYVLERLGLNNICLYGVSNGGMIALSIALKKPEIIDKMIIVSSTAKTSEKRISRLKHWEKLASEYKIEELNWSFFNSMFTSDYIKKNKDILEKLSHNGTKQECDCFSRVLRTMYNFDILDKIKQIKIPTFVLGSRLDPVFGEEASVEIAQIINCDCYIYENYSHAFYDEAPDFKHRIKEWLDKK